MLSCCSMIFFLKFSMTLFCLYTAFFCFGDLTVLWAGGEFCTGVQASKTCISEEGGGRPTMHSNFQLFSSHGTQKLITKILWHTPKYSFCWSDWNSGIILIYLHQMAIVVLAVVIFFIWHSQGKEVSVQATGTPVGNHCSTRMVEIILKKSRIVLGTTWVWKMILAYGSLKIDFQIAIGLLNSTERWDEALRSKQKQRKVIQRFCQRQLTTCIWTAEGAMVSQLSS